MKILAAMALLFIAVWSLAAVGPNDEAVEKKIQQAKSLQEKGQAKEARSICESLLPFLREQGGTSQLGLVLNIMSQLAAADGDYGKAIEWADEAIAAYRSAGDGEGAAHAYNDKGIAEVQQGSYSAAEADLQNAFTLASKAKDPENQVQILNNLGSDFYYEGKYFEALRSYQDAMSLLDQSGATVWTDYWRQITDFNFATLYQRLGRYETALQIYRRVNSSSKALSDGDRAHLAANLGALYRRLGDPWKALDSYRQAQGLYSRQHDADGELGVLKNIGIVLAMDQDDLPAAQKIFRKALILASTNNNRREEMQAHLYLGETLLREHSYNEARQEFELAGKLATELGTTEEQWKAFYGLGRISEQTGKSGDAESQYRQAISIIEKTRVQLQLSALRAEFLADKRDVYDALLRLLLGTNNAPEAFSFLERARARTFQDRITNNSNAPPMLTMQEVQSYIDPDSAVLEVWVAGDQIAILWCTKRASGIESLKLEPGERSIIEEFLKAIPGNLGADWQSQIKVLTPLQSLIAAVPLKDVTHVFIVPDGWTSILPFELLKSPSGKTLIEDADVSYIPSAVLFRRTIHSAYLPRMPWQREVTAFGDPVVAANSTNSQDFGGGSAAPLRFSATEINSIADLANGQTERFLGPNDLKKNFLGGIANSAPLLHVSTHAFADVDNPENSRLLFSGRSPDAGADYVFLREMYDLDLSNTELATISACDTERGKVIRGEGVQAFSRALLAAGSRASLTTLWKVDDEPTAEFIRQFYFYLLKEHRSKAEALRLAKLKLLYSKTRLASPQYWAAFVLNGDGRARTLRYVSWSDLGILVFVVLVFIATTLTVLLRRRLHGRHSARSVVAQ